MKHFWIVVSLAITALTGSAAAGSSLTLQERHGKQIYLRGINSAGKEITALLGNPPMETPGSLMACANCHGYDGRGKPEGGVTPSDVTWEALTKSYGVTHASGRKHPPYDDALLERSIAKGLDPLGTKLHVAMPRYEMSREDMSDLIAYLKQLGKDSDPGISDDAIILGTVVPDKGPLAETGRTIEAVLAAYFNDINLEGGIYGRKLELRPARCGETAGETTATVRRIAGEEQVFALVGAFIAGAEK